MLRTRRAATVFALAGLLACTTGIARAERPTTTQHAARSNNTAQHHDAAFIASIRGAVGAIASKSLPSGKNAPYCSRAIDIDGIFCAIGCDNSCSCSSFGIFSQCCC